MTARPDPVARLAMLCGMAELSDLEPKPRPRLDLRVPQRIPEPRELPPPLCSRLMLVGLAWVTGMPALIVAAWYEAWLPAALICAGLTAVLWCGELALRAAGYLPEGDDDG